MSQAGFSPKIIFGSQLMRNNKKKWELGKLVQGARFGKWTMSNVSPPARERGSGHECVISQIRLP